MMDASYDRKRYVRQPACVNCQTFVEADVGRRELHGHPQGPAPQGPLLGKRRRLCVVRGQPGHHADRGARRVESHATGTTTRTEPAPLNLEITYDKITG